MTSAEMLARLETLLDEVGTGFYTPTEKYAALSDGQRAVVNFIYQRDPHNQNLKTLLKTVGATNGNNQGIAVPSAFKEIVTGELAVTTGGTLYPCRVVNYDLEFITDKDNDYLKPIAASPVVYVKASTSIGRKIYFEPSSANSDYSLVIFTNPTEITSGTNPVLPDATHEAIIQWAFSFLIRKESRVAEADNAYKLFFEMVGKI